MFGELGPIIQVTPMSISFGNVAVGSTKDLSLTVKNLGGWFYLTGNATTTAPFSIFQGGYYNLGPDETRVVTVRYQPDVPRGPLYRHGSLHRRGWCYRSGD